MIDPAPGRLITLPARDVWGDEAQVFTPWLAEHVDLLADALQLGELEVRGTEVILGDFRLDILAVDGEGDRVVIENQIGRTDHGHLGQLISYVASQSGRATVIWVAEHFRESHRAAIDWLNDSTTEEFNFFAVEIEALRIGTSDPAPFFNVVAKPNSWTKTARATTTAQANDNRESHRVRLAYWAAFADYLKAQDNGFSIRREVRDNWLNFPIGRAGIIIESAVVPQKHQLRVSLYLQNDPQKAGIRQLEMDRSTIESEMGEDLIWSELPTKRASRIAIVLNDVDPSDPSQFPRLHAWMLDMMQRFRRVFAPRVKTLNLEADGPENDFLEAAL